MHAAVVTSFTAPPGYQEVPDPVASSRGQLVVDVVATALHPRVRSQADGSHYSSTGILPLVPGIDAVVRDDSGQLRYALLDDMVLGSMAERTVIETRRSVALPADTDAIAVAATMNPVMSSWVALRRRIDFRRGASVLVIGATGAAGRAAIQVARHLGAGEVIGAGRNARKLAALAELGVDRTLTLDRLAEAADVDVVIDYLWGQVSATAMVEVVSHRRDRSAPLSWIEIGSVAGPTASIPSAALRAARLTIVGSGTGSVPPSDYAAELPEIALAASRHDFAITPRVVPLADVEAAWNQTADGRQRVVFVP